jgi:hypothetical protein
MTISCWSDMKTQIIQRAFDHLRPGGWLECQEAPATIDCDDGTMPDDYAWLRWSLDFQAVSRLANRQSEVGPYLKDWMREVGFVDVQEVTFKLPLNGWPKDPRLKHIGMLWQRNLLEGVSAFSLGMFHRFMGKSVEEIEVSAECFTVAGGTPTDDAHAAALPSGRAEMPVRPQRACLPQAVRGLRPKARDRLAARRGVCAIRYIPTCLRTMYEHKPPERPPANRL